MSDLFDRQTVTDKLTRLVSGFEAILSNIRERNIDDSVCGLCEYDCDTKAGYECPGFESDDCFVLSDKCRKEWMSLDE